MSDILFLARDFIERMVNPAYGIAVNEEHALQFAVLLQREGFEERFIRELREVKEREALTSYGWLWLIGWAKSKQIELPTELLVDLFDEWSDVFIKTNVVDLATQNTSFELASRFYPMFEFPNEFLQRIMVSATRVELEQVPNFEQFADTREEFIRAEPIPTMGRSEALLVSLLQVGRPITLGAASSFLQFGWKGQRHMVNFFWLLYDRLDGESQSAWSENIPSMPERPERRRSQ
jgi:hypothetical protein